MLDLSTTPTQTKPDGRPHHYERYRIAVQWSVAYDLTPAERLILVLIASADLGNGSYNKLETMAQESGLHRATVLRALVKLHKLGIIDRDGHHRRVVRYRLGPEFLGTTLDDKRI